MSRKAIVVSTLVLVLTALVLVPAWAGGWAVVTLDSIPLDLRAGAPTEIGFTVRQHGVTPRPNLDPPPGIEARLSSTGEVFRADAKDSGAAGHYVATLLLPSAGAWTWGIRGFGDQFQPMPTLRVQTGVGSLPTPQTSPTAWMVLAGASAIGALLLLSRRKVQWATAALGVAVILGVAGVYVATPSPVQAVEAATMIPHEDGADLFLAKGCVMCHIHTRVPESASVSISVGPELSAYRNSPEFLRAWLANPAGVRPGTGMPNLGLSSAEIESLIAFLNQDR